MNNSDLMAPKSTDHSLGPVDAPVTVMEYGDFECPNCGQAAPAVKLLLEHFAGKVRFIFRHFPDKSLHSHAIEAAEAAESAGSQDRFWEMHDLLFANQLRLKPADLRAYAKRLDLDSVQFAYETEGYAHQDKINAHLEGGMKAGVRGTPGFFVNGQIQDVSFGLRQLFDRVEETLRLTTKS
jgi:protein-disulfide isomerase